jgi:hypothetical protein
MLSDISDLQSAVGTYEGTIMNHRMAIRDARAWIQAEYLYHDEEPSSVFYGGWDLDAPLDSHVSFMYSIHELDSGAYPWMREGEWWEFPLGKTASGLCVAENQRSGSSMESITDC